MAEPDPTAHEPETFADLPIQPTGSGVADLMIAREQMALADGDAGPDDEVAVVPTEDGADAADSAAHPS
jgi:hypothetical protein